MAYHFFVRDDSELLDNNYEQTNDFENYFEKKKEFK